MVLMADNCLDEYTDHGHCGIVTPKGEIDNDATLDRYAAIAIAQADAGADIVAPSGMMDGQVGAIRAALDETGHANTAILAYAAKYASALYGPFRDAAECTPQFGDRRGYQMDPANGREAITEVALDVQEGRRHRHGEACARVPRRHRRRACHRSTFRLRRTTSAANTRWCSAAAQLGWIDGDAVALEHLAAIKRAGAEIILTYFAARSPNGSTPRRDEFLVRAGAGSHPGRRQLAGSGRSGRSAAIRSSLPAPTAAGSSTPTVANTSITSSRGARRFSATRTRRSSKRCNRPRPMARRTERRRRVRSSSPRRFAIGLRRSRRCASSRRGPKRR